MAHSGEVVMWSENKGIGFIKSPDFKDDVYVHHSSFGGGSLIIGKAVTFEHDPKEGRALKVAGPAVDPRRPGAGRRGRRGSSVSSRGRGGGGRRGPVFVVKFVDLARDVDDEDVLDLLEDYNVDVDERRVLFDSRADTCFVVLDTQDDFDYCVRKLDGKRLGRSDRRCRVMRSGDRDYARAERALRDARRSRRRGGGGGGGGGGRRDPSPRRRSVSRGSSFSSRSRSRTPPRRSAKRPRRSATPDRASAAAATPAATPAAAPAEAPENREGRSRSRSPQEEERGGAAAGAGARKRERSHSSRSSRSARSATPTEKPEAKRARRSSTPERDQKEL